LPLPAGEIFSFPSVLCQNTESKLHRVVCGSGTDELAMAHAW